MDSWAIDHKFLKEKTGFYFPIFDKYIARSLTENKNNQC